MERLKFKISSIVSSSFLGKVGRFLKCPVCKGIFSSFCRYVNIVCSLPKFTLMNINCNFVQNIILGFFFFLE